MELIETFKACTEPSHMTNWQTPVCQEPNRCPRASNRSRARGAPGPAFDVEGPPEELHP